MIFFDELLQVALGRREGLSRVPSVHEWEAMYDEAERQAIVSLLLSGIEKLPVEQLPPMDVKLQWIGMTQMDEATYKMHCERAAELTRRCRAVGFSSRVLKGVAIARYYPEPERRQCGDIDLWMFGRRKDVMKWFRSQYEIEHDVWHNAGVKLFEDVPVEVHFHPGWLWNPFHNRHLQKFFEYESHELVKSDLGFNVPRLEFDAVFSLAHTYRHLIAGGVGLRHIVDYYYVLKKCHTDSTDLTNIVQVLMNVGLMKFTAAVMWVLKDVCGMPDSFFLCEPNEKEGRFLLNEIRRGGNFGHYGGDENEWGLVRQLVKMLPHYPSEVLWVVPWKCWHRCWRMVNR